MPTKKDKYQQIFNYLLEFSKLRSNPVRDIESSDTQYPDKVWFADIPQYDIFDCIIFPNYNQDADYWLKIAKPKGEPPQPQFPKLSETLSDWVEKNSLADENGMPVLKESISKGGKTILVTDKPEVETEFQTYLNEKWIDDLEFYKNQVAEYEAKLAEYEKQSKTYKHLFSIYNKAQQFGEEYELIVGVGLMHFQESASTPLICRHILTSKAEITFEFSARESFVKVSPSIENEIQIETDAILDLFEQFDSADIIEAEKKVAEFLKEKNITDSPFDSQIKEAIQIFADRIRTDGQSKDDLAKSRTVAQKPTVYFAPALLLRKRNTRSFTALYEKIIEDISEADEEIDIPSINDIIGYLENPESFPSDSESEHSGSAVDETIYFPKKYNDEQIEIIEKARKNNKVLVQGPPGTGKSHTIANLICHLLANGKKVLVTAHTERALKVLRRQLPPEFRNLTVNLLTIEKSDSEDNDFGSVNSLEASVNAINDELSRITNLNSYKKEIEEKEIELSLLKEQKANTKNEWLKVKEKSTRRQNINRNYQGTLSEIAERIEKERPTFIWFKDEFTDITKINLITDIENFYSLTRKYESIDCSVFNLIVPQKEKLLSVQELKEYRKISSDLKREYSEKDENSRIKSNYYSKVKELLGELHRLCLEIENITVEYKENVVSDFPNNISAWEVKLSRTSTILADFAEEMLEQFDTDVEIKYPNDKNLIQLKSDAEFLLELLNQGKKLTGVLSVFNPFAPANIKEKKYFVETIKVNGSVCDTIGEFKTVLTDIKIKQNFAKLEAIWGTKVNESSYFDKANVYRKQKADTERLLHLLSESNKIKTQIESASSIKIIDYGSTKILSLIEDCDYSHLLAQAKSFEALVEEANQHLSNPNMHPIATTISSAVSNWDVENYELYLSDIDRLNTEKESYSHFKKLKEDITKYFPNTIEEIWDNAFEVSNFRRLDDAIYFKHALAEISKLLEEDYETTLANIFSEIERQEEKLISLIASKKAWSHVIERLSSSPYMQQHLTAWRQAINAMPQSRTSPNYHHYRKIANKEMERCKKAVPCWIMPLYQVVENFIPQPEIFDYIIIDEASQLGPDAVFLFYLSKNIIVVGDDKQTAPQYVGVDDNLVKTLILKHLKPSIQSEIPFADFYGLKHSFFDHCDRICAGQRIVLREHFRCMPEIIEFCNKHFYAPDGKGLYPLKQYSENRLEPLKHEYCKSACVDGTYQNITNRVEAEAIANKIAELVDDENYKGKSFGVIGLQGNKQATIIENLVIKKIGEVEFKKRKIVCGNSASFQGDERDIMFLSLVTAHNHNRAALTRPEDERRFNVAVSRAKEQVWLFHSVQLDDLSNTNDLRYKLLDHFLNYKIKEAWRKDIIPIPENKKQTPPEQFRSWFEVEVYNDIVVKGYKVLPNYKVLKDKYEIDLVPVLSNGVKIAVECDGDKWHGPEQYLNDLMRQRVLERCGWQFVRIRGAEYYSNRKKALEPLWKKLRENDKVASPPKVPIFGIPTPSISDSPSTPSGIDRPLVEPELPKPMVNTATGIHKKPKQRITQPSLFETEKQAEINFKTESSSQSQMSSKIRAKKEDVVAVEEFLLFTSRCCVFKVKNCSTPIEAKECIQNELDRGERIVYTTKAMNYSGFLIVGFENGKVGKISMSAFNGNRKRLQNAFNDESKLIFIEHIEQDIDLVALSNIDKVVLFNTSKINPVDSRETKGVQVMKQKDGSSMTKLKKLNQVKLQDPEYYRRDASLNTIGNYLKKGDKV